MTALTRTVELHHHARDDYSRSLGRELTVSLVVRGDGGAVTLDIRAGWALVPFGSGWELGAAADRRPRDDGIHVHVDPCARTVDGESHGRFTDCAYTPSRHCVHDVGGIAGHALAVKLAADGPEAVWPELEEWYRARIGDRVQRGEVLDDLGDADTLAEIGGGS